MQNSEFSSLVMSLLTSVQNEQIRGHK